ncbi:hypothetical protein [Poseidonibacter lekithochrous]|uniref:hypothetical protein n=1 Tax=Poseidonibacter lekithochrous TaxID=1904463 RepID=UPI000D3AFE84|nr:hypothetical protein [Poseidonibacter lekithochrous]
MSIEVKVLESKELNVDENNIVLLPINFSSSHKDEYHSTSISFYKYVKKKIPISYFSEPKILVEQRSGDWFGPELLLLSTAILEKPNLVELTIGVIKEYIVNFFKGEEIPIIKLEVSVKETKKSKLTKISYEGDIAGIDKLKESIYKIVEK